MSGAWKSYRLKCLTSCPVEKSTGTPQPFVGLEDIESGTGALAVSNLPLKAALDSVLHHPGDVLFSKLRPYLAKSFLADSPASGTGELLVLRAQNAIDPRFLLYTTLSTPWVEWAELTSYGTKMPRTSWEAMAEYRICLPPLEEQRRIADFLDAETGRIDDLKIHRVAQQAALSEKHQQMLDMSFKSERLTHLRVKHLLGERPRYGVLVPEYVDVGVPFIRVNDLVDLEGRVGGFLNIPKELSERYRTTVVRPNDVLVSVVGTLGRSAVAPPTLIGANVNRAIAVLRARSGVLSELLSAWMGTSMFEAQAMLATGNDSAQRTLGTEDLANFHIAWPVNMTEQKRVLSDLTERQAADKELRMIIERQLATLSERRQALITAAVTGQFDVATARRSTISGGSA